MYQVGSELSVPEKFYKHVGVYVGDNRVFHNSPECGEVLTSVSEFAKGREINVTKQGVNDISGFFSRLRQSMCNPKNYNIVKL